MSVAVEFGTKSLADSYREEVLETPRSAQAGLEGDVPESQQAGLAGQPEQPSGEADVDRGENPGGIMADLRPSEEVGRGRREQQETEQRSFRDLDQDTL